MSLRLRGGTLQSLDQDGLPLYAACRQCGHYSRLNVAYLGRKFGWQTCYSELTSHLRCMRCKARGATLSIVKPVQRCPMCQRPV